ncbi:MAG: tautomerase family protein [Betaproteobacteria bacterium]|jgi:phenylpyruvate tautomerase PptA (4-oxalocrotonate tautomerase family)
MATYSIYYAGISLNTHQKFTLAQAITRVHANVTGAEAYFAQTIFKELDLHDCFIGGVLLDQPHIFLSGQIRLGRSEQVKKQLLVEIEIAIQMTTKLASHQIWAYLDELAPSLMIEYGQILPPVGNDKVWFSTLPDSVQKKLTRLNS